MRVVAFRGAGRRRPGPGTSAYAFASARYRKGGPVGPTLGRAVFVEGCPRRGPAMAAPRLGASSRSGKVARSRGAVAPQAPAATRTSPTKMGAASPAIMGATAMRRRSSYRAATRAPGASGRTPRSEAIGVTGRRRGRLRPKEASARTPTRAEGDGKEASQGLHGS